MSPARRIDPERELWRFPEGASVPIVMSNTEKVE